LGVLLQGLGGWDEKFSGARRIQISVPLLLLASGSGLGRHG
jgi:hypothetical protein